MVHWLEIVYFLILLTAILRCLYFWQLKEYRFDRFRQFLTAAESKNYWFPGRHFYRPRLTLKIILLGYLTVYFSVLVINYFPQQLLAPIMSFVLVPVSAAAAVLLLQPLTNLVIDLVVLAAKLKLGLFHRQLLVVGITGSYGKTATKEILAHVLKSKFKVAKTPETNNTLIGVAKSVLFNLPGKTQVFVVEMGAYKIGEIRQICNLAKPKIGILTGINSQHLGLFGSQENIVKAKSELLEALPSKGLAVVNSLSPLAKTAAAGIKTVPVKYYQKTKFKTNLLGSHQQINIAAAVTVARYLGVKQFNLTKIPLFKTAISKSRGLNKALVLNDSYNSNPDGFLAAVSLAKSFPAGKKWLLTNGIIELGRETEAVHQRLAVATAGVFDIILTTKAEVGGYFKIQPKSEAKLLADLKAELAKNDLLLIEGRFSQKFIKDLCQNRS